MKNFLERCDVRSQGKIWSAIIQQQIELESCSKPLKLENSCSLESKKIFSNGFGVFGQWHYDIVIEVDFEFFHDVIGDPMNRFFGSNFVGF